MDSFNALSIHEILLDPSTFYCPCSYWLRLPVLSLVELPVLGFSKTRVFKKVSGSGFTGLNPPETRGQSGMANPQY